MSLPVYVALLPRLSALAPIQLDGQNINKRWCSRNVSFQFAIWVIMVMLIIFLSNTGFPFPAVPIEYPVGLLPAIPCVGVYNSLDFPVGSVPVTNESEEDQKVGLFFIFKELIAMQ